MFPKLLLFLSDDVLVPHTGECVDVVIFRVMSVYRHRYYHPMGRTAKAFKISMRNGEATSQRCRRCFFDVKTDQRLGLSQMHLQNMVNPIVKGKRTFRMESYGLKE
jgi:hypothetical protein